MVNPSSSSHSRLQYYPILYFWRLTSWRLWYIINYLHRLLKKWTKNGNHAISWCEVLRTDEKMYRTCLHWHIYAFWWHYQKSSTYSNLHNIFSTWSWPNMFFLWVDQKYMIATIAFSSKSNFWLNQICCNLVGMFWHCVYIGLDSTEVQDGYFQLISFIFTRSIWYKLCTNISHRLVYFEWRMFSIWASCWLFLYLSHNCDIISSHRLISIKSHKQLHINNKQQFTTNQ